MAPTYKLTYFNVKALAEPIRMLFAHAGVEYEDVRIERESWPALKPQMPWNVMPVLEEDGKQLSQSATILRYLGRKFGFAGSDEFQTAKCNEYVDAMTDIRLEAFKFFKEEDATKKAAAKKKLEDEVMPNFYKKISEILKKNGNNVLVGSGITYADIHVAFMLDFLSGFVGTAEQMKTFPEVMAHQNKVFSSPGIKAWIAKRPVTDM